MVTIVRPLPDVAHHVEKAKLVSAEATYWRGKREAVRAPVGVRQGKRPLGGLVGHIGISAGIRTCVAPKPAHGRPGPRRVLPLSFARKAVGLPRSLAQPLD